MNSTTKHSWKPYAAWLSLNLFFLYIYILRVSSGLMFGELREEFSMTGEQFGIFVAFYLYTYAFVQVPVGALLDHLGIRKVALVASIIVMLSVWVLSIAEHLYLAYASRALLGLGSACGFMASLKFASDKLPVKLRGIFMGLTLSMGTVGALGAGNVIPDMLKLYEWRDLFGLILYGGVPLMIMMFLFLPKTGRAHNHQKIDWQHIGHTVNMATSNRHILLYGILSIGAYSPLAAIADSWGAAFLKEKYTWDAAKAGSVIMNMYVGLSLGSLLLPWLSRVWGDYNRVIQISLVGLCGFFALLLYYPHLAGWELMTCLLAIGVLCGSEMLCFTGASHYSTPETSGVTLGVVNTFNMLGAALLNHAVGMTLDMNWGGHKQGALRVYTADNYVAALSILFITVVICLLVSLKLKKPQKTDILRG